MKFFVSVLITTFSALAWVRPAMAQEMDKAPTLNPLEVYTCNYLDGKDRGDLDKVIDRWNTWTDANDPAPYTAWF